MNTEYPTRRSFLKALGAASAITIVGTPVLGSRAPAAYAFQGGGDTVLVNIFLRGGADGLGIVVPYGDDMLYTRRPVLGRPVSELHDLDGFFGLDPAFGGLVPDFLDGRIAFIHAVGKPTANRSHFAAMPIIDRSFGPGGWMQRAILAGSFDPSSSGLTIGSRVSPCLSGPAFGRVLTSVSDAVDTSIALADIKNVLSELYTGAPFLMDRDAVVGSLASIDQVAAIVPTTGSYPDSPAGYFLQQVASLIKADIGVRAASFDLGGWDTHQGQADTLAAIGVGLGEALAAFQLDLGSHASRVVTVTTSEFGRTVNENASGGTDHGRGSMMMVMGEPLVDAGGGQVHVNGGWPGLGADDLDPQGDLKVTTDYRAVLSELVSAHLGIGDVSSVFPGHTPAPIGLLNAAAPNGDVNQSGVVDEADINAVLADAVGTPAPDYVAAAGDLDGDGDTDLLDALLLAQQVQQ